MKKWILLLDEESSTVEIVNEKGHNVLSCLQYESDEITKEDIEDLHIMAAGPEMFSALKTALYALESVNLSSSNEPARKAVYRAHKKSRKRSQKSKRCKMKNLKLKFYADPGHGWLAVKRKVLADLGILNQITRFSYEKCATVYLEEDADVTLFMETTKKLGIQVDVTYKHTNNSSPIRSYNYFKAV